MKKRQVMALILAAALALPNTGAFAGITGTPATVEAAGVGSRAFSPSTLALGTASPSASASMSSVQGDLNDDAAANKVTKTEAKNTVGKVITVDNGWELLNGSDSLKRGKGNVAKLRYTFAKEEQVTGNDWKKNSDGLYYGDFDVEFEVVEAIAPATVLDNCKWPTLNEKEYKAGGNHQTYWNDDLKSGSSEYGTFGVADTAVSAPGDQTVTVTLTLNPGYEFSADTYETGKDITEGATTYTKDYTVKVNKAAIENFEWPEIAKEGIVYNGKANALTLTASKDAAKVTFELYEETGKTKVDGLADTVLLKKGINKFKIKAIAKDTANNVILEKDTWKDVSIEVAAPAMTKVEAQQKDAKGDLSEIGGEVNGGTAVDASVKLSAVDTWTPAFDDDAARDKIYEMKYQWYKDGAIIPGEDAKAQDYVVEKTAPGQYYCEVSAKVQGSATIAQGEDYKDQPVMSTQKVDVSFSAITITNNTVTVANNTSLVYGKITDEPTFTVPVEGLTDKAQMTLVVKSGDKDVTDAVKSMISGKPSTIAEDGTASFVITVNKNVDAGAYTYAVKVKDGSSSVTLLHNDLASTVDKQEVQITDAYIKPVNGGIVHGDAIEKLTGVEYVAPENATTVEKRAVQAVNEKVAFTVEDCKTNFANGYFDAKAATKEIKVKLELKESYKKNYKLDSRLDNVTPSVDDVKTSDITIDIGKMKITLGIEKLPMVQGDSLPKRTITGADFVERDDVKVVEKGYTLYEKDDKNRTPIKNGVELLKAGDYIISVDLVVRSANASNYEINGTNATDDPSGDSNIRTVNAELTIYASEHVVGFVTDGGNAIADRNVYHNNEIGALPTPVRSGYKFLGWFADRKYTTPVTASTKVTGDMTLFAKWEKTSSTSGGSEETPGTGSTVKVGTKVSSSSGTFSVTSVTANKKTVSYKAASKSAKSVTIPSSVKIKGVTYKVTRVANSAFSGCKNLTKVTIPSTVTSIGTSSFKNCTKLTSVTIPKYVKVIDASAFSGCSKLKSVTFKGTKINKIGKSAFKGIAKKSVIKVPKSKKTTYKKLLKKSGYTKTVK